MIDFSDVINFERKLNDASDTDNIERGWKKETSKTLAETMSASAPRRTGQLANSIRGTEEGVSMVDYYRFVEYGTVHMSPQPFIRPALRRETPRAVEDLGTRTLRELT